MKILRALLRKAAAVPTFPCMLVLILAVAQAPRGYAQVPAPPDGQRKVAALHEPAADVAPSRAATVTDPQSSLDLAKELAAMKARIEQLEAELRVRIAAEAPPAAGTPARVAEALPVAAPVQAMAAQPASESPAAALTRKPKIDPFSDSDWTWLNGNPRTKDISLGFEILHPRNPG